MKRESLGNLVWTYPKKKRTARLYFFWAFSKVHKVVIFFLWGLVKIQNAAMSKQPPSSAPVPADRSYVDDGRYDYGLSQPTGYGIKSEHNIEIPVRDGTKLRADLYRPDGPGRFPVIMAEAPYPRYQKIHVGVDDNGGVGTKYWYFEQANPEYWVPRGYIYISLSARGYGGSGGHTSVLDYQEIEDYHDAIEWAAEQPWSDGNIGLYGISYYAVSQYWVAGLHPPHLKAIVPWEGLVEPYRDIGYRGGIPCMFSVFFAAGGQIIANNQFESKAYLKSFLDNPLFNEIWEYGIGALSRPKDSTPAVRDVVSEIDVPMLSVGNLNDPDLHLQGNVYAFKIARSPYKKLHLYTGTHWGSAYQPWANRTVLRFFDHWLKGTDTGIESEPAVNVELRTGPDTFTHVFGDTWPLERTQWTKYHLEAEDKTLSTVEPEKESSVEAKYTKDPVAGNSDQITFLTEPLPQDVQVAGPLSAHLWVSSSESDVDLTVEVRDFDENAHETRFAYYIAGMPDEPVTRGWLRTSLRALDPDRTLPHQPYHLFTRNDWLTPGVPVLVDVEIWPTGMLFKAGHRIALTIHCGPHHRPGEVTYSGKLLPFSSRTMDVKAPAYQTFSPESGTTKLYTGGEHSSWLELPVIPADLAPSHRITIQDRGFTPALTSGGMGDRFDWTNNGEDYHSVTESSGLDLWDSQLVRGKRSHNPETWWTKIPWAGTFNYRDEVSGFEGSIDIPDRVAESSPEGSQVNVELGIAALPDGIGFDVQLKAGDGEWNIIHEGVRDTRITMDTLPSGSYAVRSRLRSLDTAEPASASGWSPPAPFDVK
jgi:predicted acyl esterase/plastocyanin